MQQLNLERRYESTLTVGIPKHAVFGLAEIKLHGHGSVTWRYLSREDATALHEWLGTLLASQPEAQEAA